jgi:hypothetical protein
MTTKDAMNSNHAPVTQPRHRRRGTAALVAVAAAMALVAAACNVNVDAHTLTVVQSQEDGFLQNGDEPYLATIQFRSTPGVAGSTNVNFLGNLSEVGSGMDDGDSASIPDAMANVTFNDVTPVSLQMLLANGTLPEVLGTVMIAMESDFTSWGTINNLMEDVADALETELALAIEPLTIADITDPSAVADALAGAAANVEAAATPSTLQAIGIWLGSLGNPDDLIDIGFTVWIPTAGALGSIVESSLISALPADATGHAWSTSADPVNKTIRFQGDSAIYDVDITTTLTQ